MCSNVIASAPHDESSLYPQLPQYDFRMQKGNEVEAALNAEVSHYRGVAKNISEPKKLSTGVRQEPAFFLLRVALQVSGRRSLSLASLSQFHLAVSVAHSLSLPLG